MTCWLPPLGAFSTVRAAKPRGARRDGGASLRGVDAFFEPLGGGRYAATELTRGPWDAQAQHGGPPAALLGRALERCRPRDDSLIVRVTVEILRPVPLGVLEVSAEVVRPGRSVELLAGEVRAAGTPVLRAAAWRIRTDDVGVEAGTQVPPPRGPDTLGTHPPFEWTAEVGYHVGIEWRFVAGEFLQGGPATVWMRMRYPLVAGEQPSPLSRVLIAADSGNGISGVLDFSRFLFVNTDLTVALHRHPGGEWVCLDAATTVQPHGTGLASSSLFDEQGPLGRALQSLYVARR